MATNFFTVDKIIRGVLLNIGEDTLHQYHRLLPHAYDFLDQFKSDSAREVKTKRLRMSPQRTVQLPADFINYTKVGVQVGDYVRTLAYNADIPNLPECKEETGSIYQPWDDSYPVVDFLNWGGRDALMWFGYGGYRESFSLDRTARVMRFGSEVNVGHIYLEYISSEVGLCAETPVNPMAKPAMENYILWKYYLLRKDGIYRQYEDYYYREYTKLHGRMDPFSMADVYDLLESNYSLGPKS